MHRFMNSLAHTEYKQDVTAVEIDFQGFGSKQVYYQTMEIAANLVILSKKNCWLLVKDNFDDMGPYHFLTFLQNWFKHPAYKRCEQTCGEEARVAILTHTTILNQLKQTFRHFEFCSTIPSNISLGFFADRKAANAFLKRSYADLQVYQHGEPVKHSFKNIYSMD